MIAAAYIAFVNSLSNIYYSIFLALTMYIFLVVKAWCCFHVYYVNLSSILYTNLTSFLRHPRKAQCSSPLSASAILKPRSWVCTLIDLIWHFFLFTDFDSINVTQSNLFYSFNSLENLFTQDWPFWS